MSGIAGIVRLDGQPVDARDVAFLAAGVAHLGADHQGRWEGDGVAFLHAQLTATPEAAGERQPCVDRASGVAVVLDGRLDNRDELLKALAGSRPSGSGPPLHTDAEILMQAYLAWGSDFVPRLLGDFAFAVWDGRRRRLILGRDPLGVRPLLYRIVGRRLAFASAVKPLAALPDAPTRPNPGMVAEYLASALTSRRETVYEGVYRLPAAHTLTVEGAVRLRRYWDVDPTREVQHSSDGEYAEQLKEILTSAVLARTRTVGPVAAELSGGLDSSTLVGITSSAAGRMPHGSGDVRALSLVYPGEAADESQWIDAVADFWGIVPIKMTPQKRPGFDFFVEARRTGEIPDFPVLPHWDVLFRRARDLGARSILNGVGGDEWFTGSPWETADLLRAGRIRDSVSRARVASRHELVPIASAVWRFGVRPLVGSLLPGSVPGRMRARRLVRRARWIPRIHARAVALEERVELAPPRNLRTLSQAQILYSLNSGDLAAECEALSAAAHGHGIELRMPFLDRRLVELALAVPEAQRCGTDRPKRLLRAAASDLVPDRLLARIDKPGPGHLMAQELLSPRLSPYLGFARLAEAGWVDAPRLRDIHAQLATEVANAQAVTEDHLWPLWRALAVEMWLRATFDTPPPTFGAYTAPEPG